MMQRGGGVGVWKGLCVRYSRDCSQMRVLVSNLF